jgi:hypothetical protein
MPRHPKQQSTVTSTKSVVVTARKVMSKPMPPLRIVCASLTPRLILKPPQLSLSKPKASVAGSASQADAKGVVAKPTREILPSGLVEHGYEDFQVGSQSTPANSQMAPEMKNRAFEVLTDWKPIVTSVPSWRAYLSKEPLVKQIFTLDCGAENDCMFNALQCGLNLLHRGPAFSSEQMRQIAADQITVANVDAFLATWDPPKSILAMPKVEQRVAQAQELIRRPHGYWGEIGTLEYLLLNAPAFRDRQIGFAVISIRDRPVERRPPTETEKQTAIAHGKKPPLSIINRTEPRAYTHILRQQSTKHLLALYNWNSVHWLLVGVAQSPQSQTVASSFPIDSYPPALYAFLREPDD